MEVDEQKLIQSILHGDTERYRYFMQKYGTQVLALIVRIVKDRQDAEELTQDVFVKVFNALSDFRGEASFRTWLMRIAYNTAQSYLRKHKPEIINLKDDEQFSESVNDKDLDDDEKELDEKRIMQLYNAIDYLSSDEKTIITQYYLEEVLLKDIAFIMDIEPGTVYTRLHRIKKKLHNMIKRAEDEQRR